MGSGPWLPQPAGPVLWKAEPSAQTCRCSGPSFLGTQDRAGGRAQLLPWTCGVRLRWAHRGPILPECWHRGPETMWPGPAPGQSSQARARPGAGTGRGHTALSPETWTQPGAGRGWLWRRGPPAPTVFSKPGPCAQMRMFRLGGGRCVQGPASRGHGVGWDGLWAAEAEGGMHGPLPSGRTPCEPRGLPQGGGVEGRQGAGFQQCGGCHALPAPTGVPERVGLPGGRPCVCPPRPGGARWGLESTRSLGPCLVCVGSEAAAAP